MGYVKNEWNTGDVVTAAKLNNIEDGIDKAIEKPDSGNVNDVLTKTENGVKWAPPSGGSGTEKFTVTFNHDSSVERKFTCDKTITEIYNAYNSGKIIEGILHEPYDSDPIYTLYSIKETEAAFVVVGGVGYNAAIYYSNNEWRSIEIHSLPSCSVADVNKVLSIDEDGDPIWKTPSGGEDKILVVTTYQYGYNQHRADKTASEIYTAATSGKEVVMYEIWDNTSRDRRCFELTYVNKNSDNTYDIRFTISESDGEVIECDVRFIIEGDASSVIYDEKYAIATTPKISGAAGKFLRVKDDEEGVEWATVGGGKEDYLVTFTRNSSVISADKSITEILSAITANKNVYGKFDDFIYEVSYYDVEEKAIEFSNIAAQQSNIFINVLIGINDGTDTWMEALKEIPSGENDIFKVVMTWDEEAEEDTVLTDKTAKEIYDAYVDEKIVFGIFESGEGGIYQCLGASCESVGYSITFANVFYTDENSIHGETISCYRQPASNTSFPFSSYSNKLVPEFSSSTDDGKVLTVDGNDLEWKTPSGGGSTPDAIITCYDDGSGGTWTVSCNKTYNELKTIIQNHGRIQMQHRHEYEANAYFIDDVSYCIMDNSDIIFQAVTPDAPSYSGKLLRHIIKVTSENIWTWYYSRFINTPIYGDSDANKVLKVNSGATGVEWADAQGGETEVFVVNIVYNSETEEYESDKTLIQIQAAALQNKAIIANYYGLVLPSIEIEQPDPEDEKDGGAYFQGFQYGFYIYINIYSDEIELAKEKMKPTLNDVFKVFQNGENYTLKTLDDIEENWIDYNGSMDLYKDSYSFTFGDEHNGINYVETKAYILGGKHYAEFVAIYEIDDVLNYDKFVYCDGNGYNPTLTRTITPISGGSSDDKMDKTNPTGTGSFSLNRSGIKTGTNSVAIGAWVEASGDYSYAEGYITKATGYVSHAEGSQTIAKGGWTHAEGLNSVAEGVTAHAEGYHTKAQGEQSVSGIYNYPLSGPQYEQNVSYQSIEYINGQLSYTIKEGWPSKNEAYFIILQGEDEETQTAILYENSDYTLSDDCRILTLKQSALDKTSSWSKIIKICVQLNPKDPSTYLHIIGNGAQANQSNAYALSSDGTGRYAGNVYVNCEKDSSGGKKLATEEYVDAATGGSDLFLVKTVYAGSSQYRADKTASEIYEAVQAGKKVVMQEQYSDTDSEYAFFELVKADKDNSDNYYIRFSNLKNVKTNDVSKIRYEFRFIEKQAGSTVLYSKDYTSAPNYPSLTGEAGKVLKVREDEEGFEWAEDSSSSIPKIYVSLMELEEPLEIDDEIPESRISFSGEVNYCTLVKIDVAPNDMEVYSNIDISDTETGSCYLKSEPFYYEGNRVYISFDWSSIDPSAPFYNLTARLRKYTPKELPTYTSTDANKVLAVNAQGTGIGWNTAGGAEKFVCNITHNTVTEVITCDKTAEEIYNAYTSGKVVEAVVTREGYTSVNYICRLRFAEFRYNQYNITFVDEALSGYEKQGSNDWEYYDGSEDLISVANYETAGDILYASDSWEVEALPIGSSGQVLTVENGLPAWQTPEKELPTRPTTDGTYVLKCTVTSGTPVLSWVADT